MGRKSLNEQRREEILAAFERLIISDGLEVPLERVADAAGLQRSLIRHYVGNRDELVEQVMERIAEAYPRRVAEQLQASAARGSAGLLDAFFDDTSDTAGWEEIILAVAQSAQGRYPGAKEHITRVATAIVRLLADNLGPLYPTATPAALYAAAYGVVCLAQTDYTLRCLGLDPGHKALARTAAERLLSELGGETCADGDTLPEGGTGRPASLA